jgi:membrane-associated protein
LPIERQNAAVIGIGQSQSAIGNRQSGNRMDLFHKLFFLLRHLGDDSAWRDLLSFVGLIKLQAIMCLIIFCETGVVIWPFLPGDSLIFAIGAVAGRDVGFELTTIGPCLVLAALLGDNVNYWIGRKVGPAVFSKEDSKLFNKHHLHSAQAFYTTHGSKTVILARFVPIVRTFAPFVAGIGQMPYAKFLTFSILGAIAWVGLCLLGGFTLGSRPFFKQHFELVVLAIVAVSLIPVAVEFFKARNAAKAGRDPLVAATTLAEKPEV